MRPKLKPTQHPDPKAFIPVSVLLQQLHDEAPADHFTLGWLTSRLHKRSFGLIMLLLAVVAIAPLNIRPLVSHRGGDFSAWAKHVSSLLRKGCAKVSSYLRSSRVRPGQAL